VWVVLASTAFSGFFALVGYSLRTYRRVELEEAFAGEAGQRRLAALERQESALRLTASLCRSVSNLVLVVSMVYWLTGASGGFGRVAGATAGAAAIIAIFGVAIPHAWSAHASEKVLAATLGVMLICRYAMYPVVAVMEALEVPIRRLAGAGATSDQNGAKQEILQAASDGQAEGAVDADEVEMIESVMEFGETQAGEIMTPRTDIFALSVDTPWDQARRQIVEAGHTRVPVYEGEVDNVIGVLYAKDLLGDMGEGSKPLLRSLFRKPFFVPETKRLDDLLKEFKARKVHLAIVLDEYGGTAGLVTIEDVLEEIVGDIADEYDRAAPAMLRRIDARTVETDGRLPVDELNDALELEIPEDEDYDTVAGLVFSEMGYIPAVDEQLESHGARFTVLAADERKITALRVERLQAETESQ